MYNGRHCIGKIEENGTIRDSRNNYAGEMNSWGHVYDCNKNYCGKIKDGLIYNADGKIVGRINEYGDVYGSANHIKDSLPILNTDVKIETDYGVPFAFKLIMGIFFFLGVATVGIYCWLQLVISAAVSVGVIIAMCRHSYKTKNEKPGGTMLISFLITYIPTLIIILAQDFSNMSAGGFAAFLCHAGGFAIGIAVSFIVSKITVGICGAVLSNK